MKNDPGVRRAACLLLCLSCGYAAADEPAAQLDPIQVTAGRQPEPQFEVPQPLTIVTRELIEERHPQVMTEALRYEPGAFFQQTGPGQGIVIVRGLKGAEVLHLIDGMRLNNAFFRTAPSQYIALLDPNNIEQIELLRGPYAAVYGSDAMGGVLQVLTPEVRFGGAQLDWQGGARARYASADLARVGRVWAATGNQTFSVAAGFSFLDYGNRKLPEGGQSPDHQGGFSIAERVEDTAYLGRGYDLKALWTLAPAQELMFAFQHFDLPALPRYNETVPGSGTATGGLPAVAISIYDNQRTSYHLRYRHSAPVGFMDSLELHLAHQVIVDDRIDRTQNNSRDTFEFNRSALTGLTAQAVTASGPHALLYGVELYSDRIDSRSVRQTPPASGTFTFNSTEGFQSRFPDGARADDFGLYLMDTWSVAPRWQLQGGGRYSWHRTELPIADRAVAATLKDSDFTGNLGLRYALTPALAWTLNTGRGYRAPNINDLAQVGRRSNNRVVVANFDLKPESVASVDSGFKFSQPGLAAEATLFYSDYADRITLVSGLVPEGTGGCPDDGDADAEPCAQNRNLAEAIYYGFEGGVRWVALPQLALRGTLNYTFGQQEDGTSKTPGNRVPPLNGQVAAEFRPLPGVVVEPWAFFADRQDRLDPADLADNRIDPEGTPGYAVWNLRLRWQAREWLGLQLDGTNLADRVYREHGSGIDGAARGFGVAVDARF